MNLDWEPGNNKQNNVVCISVSSDNSKIAIKEIPKLFFQDYHCDMANGEMLWNVAEMWILKR